MELLTEFASQTKSSARASIEALIRPLVQRVQANTGVGDSHRAGLGVSLRSTARTPVGAPESRPVGTIDTSQRLRHTISFSDESTPTRRAKPEGEMGCEIWVKIGDRAQVDPSELRFLRNRHGYALCCGVRRSECE